MIDDRCLACSKRFKCLTEDKVKYRAVSCSVCGRDICRNAAIYSELFPIMIDTGLRENTYANDDPDFFCQKCWDSPHRLEMIISRTEWMTKEEELFQAWKKDSLNESN